MGTGNLEGTESIIAVESLTTSAPTRPAMTRRSNAWLFILSDVITQFGAGMVISASAWFVFDKTHSSSLVAGVASANTLGGVLVSLAAGALIDRFRPKSIALASHAIRVTFMTVPLILFATFGFHPAFAFILALDNGIGWNLYFPASKAIVQRLSGDGGTAGMNSLAEVSMQVGLFSAGAIAGVVYRGVGFYPILAASAAAMCVGIIILSRVDVPEPPEEPQADNESRARSFRSGFTYLRQRPRVLVLSLVLCSPFIVATIGATALPGYANVDLGVSSVGYGLIATSWGAGACIAGLTLGRIGEHLRRTAVVISGLCLLAAYGGVMALNTHLPLAVIATVIAGLAAAATRIALYTEIMATVPSRFLGRVLALGNLASLLLQTLLAQSAGVLMDNTAPRYGYLLVVLVAGTFAIVFVTTRAPASSTD
ncbi:MFS transporter [Nocardia sp. NPDC051030]|uniref:MFS transporter n=1 Tax=Nocardia sp. NPDC051030 TaxID=3155162 RepID=UPI00343C4D18